jgi:molecular chaperone Hsp33
MGIQEDELTDIIETDKKAELVCHYCNKKYIFCIDELNQLLEEKKRIKM